MVTVQQYGATAIDYTKSSPEECVIAHTDNEGFDIIYDTVGGITLDHSFNAVKQYAGHVLSILGWGTHNLAPLSFHGATYSGVFTLYPLLTGKGRAHHGEILREATKLIEAGSVKPTVDANKYDMETVAEAYQAIEAGTAKGKIVIEIA